MTLGSLFDGSGTMPYAATLCGITPIWSSEIEKYPLALQNVGKRYGVAKRTVCNGGI